MISLDGNFDQTVMQGSLLLFSNANRFEGRFLALVCGAAFFDGFKSTLNLAMRWQAPSLCGYDVGIGLQDNQEAIP